MIIQKKRKKKRAKKYTAKANIDIHQLTKAGSAINLTIFDKKTKVGELLIGRGAVYWYGAHKQKPQRIAWGRFTEVMDQVAFG